MNRGGGGPAPWEGAGAGGQTTGTADGENPAPVEEKSKVISDLSDIPAVREYLRRIGADVRSMLTAVVREEAGRYWRDRATIKLDKDTGETAVGGCESDQRALYEPTDAEAATIKAACAGVNWPEAVALTPDRDGMPSPLPPALRDVDPENIFAFHDEEGQVVMLQRRGTDEEVAEGKPKYTPYSYWSDNRWRAMEPGGLLPLWGSPQLKEAATVILHEGAKAARNIQRIVEGAERGDRECQAKLAAHPWGQELQGAAHIGWVGGALSAHRTDWAVLKRAGITRVIIVADNDAAGVEAVPKIAKQLRMPTFAILWTDEWPPSFDLGDKFPAKMFDANGRYTGPSFAAMLEPATWATDSVAPEGGGKPRHYLRPHFASQWVYADEPELFVCKEDTRIVRSAENLSRKLVKYSDSPGTGRMLGEACEQVTTLAYAPDKRTGTVTVRDQRAFNLYRPSSIKPREGSEAPWLEFLAYLFPLPDERKEGERWCATLIAHPGVRMHYGLLLASETQGVGKGIFASQVLAPLIGEHNTGYPSEHDIVESAFNDWMAHKRLVVVGEIYQGSSWKAYNRLKGLITDKDFEVNKKHQAKYRIDNWCHVVACSNSYEALKMERTDRRWFYPQVAETPWPREKFAEFVSWLQGDGLGIIARWANEYGDYVKTGELPRMTPRKALMIEESEAEELRWIREYCAERIADEESFAVSTAIAHSFAKRHLGKTLYTKARAMGAAMLQARMVQLAKPDGSEFTLKYHNERHRVFLSPKARVEMEGAALAGDELKEWLRTKLGQTLTDLGDGRPF